jgi:ligand-binding sensor domain-containing protein
MKSKIAIILLILVIGCSFNRTNTHQEKKTSIFKEVEIAKATVKKMLVSDEIRCISAGSDSVWVGTDKGVSVYHKGKGFDTPSATQPKGQWTAINRENGLVSEDVSAIAVDKRLVWIGTRLGVSCYDTSNKTTKTYQRRDGLASNNITAIAVDGNYVWFGTDNGISRLDKTIDAWALKREKGEQGINIITAIAVEADYVWFGTQDGLRRYEKGKDSWNIYTEKDGLVQDYVRCIAVGEDSVWIGTEKSGVSQYSKTDQSFIKSYTKTDILSSNFIQTIAVDGSNIWFGSSDYGIRRYLTTVDTWFSYTTKQSLASEHITWISIDGNDIWIGTYEYGVSRYNKVANNWISYRQEDTLVSNHIKALVAQESDIWIGTTEGLSRYDPIKQKWTNYTKADGLVTNYITSLATSLTNHDETLWMGTSLGLGKFNPTSEKWQFYTKANGLCDNFVTNISVEEHQIWVATKKGLCKLQRLPSAYRQKQRTTSAYRVGEIAPDTWRSYLTGKWVTSVVSTNGEVWAGTTDGLYQFNPKTEQFEAISSVKNYVNTIAEIPPNPPFTKGGNGELFVGTEAGLFIVDKRRLNVEHLTIKDGLPNNNIRVIVSDSDAIWLGTPKGLARLDTRKRKIQIFTMKTPTHLSASAQAGAFGLPRSSELLHVENPDFIGDNIQSILLKDEKVWIGTVAGLTSYDKRNNQWESYNNGKAINHIPQRKF